MREIRSIRAKFRAKLMRNGGFFECHGSFFKRPGSDSPNRLLAHPHRAVDKFYSLLRQFGGAYK